MKVLEARQSLGNVLRKVFQWFGENKHKRIIKKTIPKIKVVLNESRNAVTKDQEKFANLLENIEKWDGKRSKKELKKEVMRIKEERKAMRALCNSRNRELKNLLENLEKRLKYLDKSYDRMRMRLSRLNKKESKK